MSHISDLKRAILGRHFAKTFNCYITFSQPVIKLLMFLILSLRIVPNEKQQAKYRAYKCIPPILMSSSMWLSFAGQILKQDFGK